MEKFLIIQTGRFPNRAKREEIGGISVGRVFMHNLYTHPTYEWFSLVGEVLGLIGVAVAQDLDRRAR
jgi:hypothetical protein